MSILRLENVTYSYENKYQKNQVLKGISAEFERGKIYALIGKSGSGKSTARVCHFMFLLFLNFSLFCKVFLAFFMSLCYNVFVGI